MKLKCIAALCKGRKMVCIHSDNNSQYVGDGSACYLVPGELTLDRDNVLIIFDVPEDKQDSWTISSTGFPQTISMADVLEGEEQALIYPIELCCGEHLSDYQRFLRDCPHRHPIPGAAPRPEKGYQLLYSQNGRRGGVHRSESGSDAHGGHSGEQ